MITGILGFVLALGLILLTTKLCGMLFRKIGLPQVLGYIIAGILIGPAIFGLIPIGENGGFALISAGERVTWSLIHLDEFEIGSSHYTVLDVFSKVGVIMIMFSAGLETNMDDLKKTGLKATLIAFAGVLVPMALGILVSLPFIGKIDGFNSVLNGVFLGTILTATSVAITVSVLKELGKINSRVGTMLVSAAVIDDIIGMIVLSVVSSFAPGGAGALTGFAWFKAQWWGTIIMIISFFAVAIGAGIGLHFLFKWMDKKWPNTRRLPILSLAVCFIYAVVAEEVFGVADITGAYIAGVMLSTINRMAKYTDRKIDINNYMLFGPVFFASVGINMDLSGLFGNGGWMIIVLAILFVVVGLLGKVVGCGAVVKLGKGTWREAGITGVGMMARGEVALIVTQKGLDIGMIPGSFMIMTVLLILVSSILTPILLKLFFKGHKEGGDALPVSGTAAGEAGATGTTDGPSVSADMQSDMQTNAADVSGGAQ